MDGQPWIGSRRSGKGCLGVERSAAVDTNVPEGLGEAWIGMDPQQRHVSERKAWEDRKSVV